MNNYHFDKLTTDSCRPTTIFPSPLFSTSLVHPLYFKKTVKSLRHSE